MAGDVEVIWVKREWKYFCRGGLDDPNQIETKGDFLFAVLGLRTPNQLNAQSP
jgi:hypothetical protein